MVRLVTMLPFACALPKNRENFAFAPVNILQGSLATAFFCHQGHVAWQNVVCVFIRRSNYGGKKETEAEVKQELIRY